MPSSPSLPDTLTVRPATVRRTHPTALRVATAASAATAVLYLAIFAGVLSVGRADVGELGILGVAGGMFAVFTALLWWVRRPAVWLAVALVQLPLAAMYVAIAPERDPSFELWGLTIRALSVVLVVALVRTFLEARRQH
jgi:hypothetical protein